MYVYLPGSYPFTFLRYRKPGSSKAATNRLSTVTIQVERRNGHRFYERRLIGRDRNIPSPNMEMMHAPPRIAARVALLFAHVQQRVQCSRSRSLSRARKMCLG